MSPATAAHKGYRYEQVKIVDSAVRRDGWRVVADDRANPLASHLGLFEACRWVRDLRRATDPQFLAR